MFRMSIKCNTSTSSAWQTILSALPGKAVNGQNNL